MKCAVYTGTRNLYTAMETAAKSLIYNSSVDRIYFLIEDNEFPVKLPDIIHVRNVSGQNFFPADGPNMKTKFTYMALLRVCYTKLFPDLDRILQLDVDTICTDDIDDIWNTDLSDHWCAMVPEYLGTWKPYGRNYYNAGVALYDLDKMRSLHIDNELIKFLNKHYVPYVDQDAVNRAARKMADLDVKYNETFVTGYTDHPHIVHYAGRSDWQISDKIPRREYIRKYQDMSWNSVMKKYNSKKVKK